jgi:hypothetical protein
MVTLQATPVFFKGIDRPSELRDESRLIRSVITNWMLRKFFLSHFEGSSSQDQQKTLGCRLKSLWLVKVTLCWFFWLRKVILPNCINSVMWILLFVVFLQGYPLFCKSLVMVVFFVFLCMKLGGFFYIIFSKFFYLLKKVLWMKDPVYSFCHRYTK